ncbi:MAG: hypothetical protein IVW55_15995 [Chloroflexi bacterium]|nr:hypothetical protein [Chloroflexota bacterium]
MSTTDYNLEERDDPEAPMHCVNHPSVETYLRCGKCGAPICARCRVSTPAGFRCFNCANLQTLPTYAVSSDYYLRGAAAGLVAGGVVGVLMGFFPAFEFWAALLMGIAVPEAISAATNQKRSPGLQTIAVSSVIFGFIISRVVLNAFPFAILLGGVNFPGPGGIPLLDSLPFYLTQYSIMWLALAAFFAYRRLQ